MADPKLATVRSPLSRAYYRVLVLGAALRLLAKGRVCADSFTRLADDMEGIARLLEEAGAREA